MKNKTARELKDIGNGLFDTGKYHDAIKYFSLAIKADPTDAESYDSKAVVLFQ